MIKRVVSGAVLVLFLAAVILFNRSFPLALNLVVALVSAASVFELTKALGLERKWFLFLPSLAMAAAASFCGENLFAVYCLYTLVLFSAMLRYHRETTFKEVAVLYSMVVMIPSALNCLVLLRGLSQDHGMFYVLVAVLAGLATGLVTGLLHTFMGIPAILAGILTQLALYSINLKIMGKANQSINVDKYDLLISLRWVKELALHNPIIMVILVSAVVIGVLYWFFGTELGCGIRATGSNPAMSRAQGINTSFNVVLGLAVSNGLVALSGALLSQYQGFADVSMGRGAIVIGLAAVIIGEALFSRIFHNFALKLVSVSLGAIIYYIVIQLVLTLGFDANLLKLLSASVVAVFLAVPYWKSKYFAKPAAKKAQKEDAKNA